MIVVYACTRKIYLSCMCAFIVWILFVLFYLYRYSSILFPRKIPRSSITFPPITPEYNLPKKTICFTDFFKYAPRLNKTIPPIIFRTSPFTLQTLHPDIKKVLNDTLRKNKEYTQVHVSDHESELFIKTCYPYAYPYYQRLIPGAFKADLLRLLLLYHYGGVYNDIGHSYVTSLSSFLSKKDELVLVNEYDTKKYGFFLGYHQAFIASYPRHPVIMHMIRLILHNIKERNYGIAAIDITGPLAISRAFNNFFSLQSDACFEAGHHRFVRHSRFRVSLSYRVHLLSFQQDDMFDTMTRMLCHYKKGPVIQCKFDGYNKIMYNNRNVPRWDELWCMGLAYR